MRFVIGHSADEASEAALAAEADEHGDFWRLDLVEGYAGLPDKTLAFLKARGTAWGLLTVATCSPSLHAATAGHGLRLPACLPGQRLASLCSLLQPAGDCCA